MTGWAIWIGKIRRLSSQAKDTEGALIGVMYENLPDILKKHIKLEFKDWDKFIKEAQDVKESDIRQSVTISLSYAYHTRTYPTFSSRTLDVTMTSL